MIKYMIVYIREYDPHIGVYNPFTDPDLKSLMKLLVIVKLAFNC